MPVIGPEIIALNALAELRSKHNSSEIFGYKIEYVAIASENPIAPFYKESTPVRLSAKLGADWHALADFDSIRSASEAIDYIVSRVDS